MPKGMHQPASAKCTVTDGHFVPAAFNISIEILMLLNCHFHFHFQVTFMLWALLCNVNDGHSVVHAFNTAIELWWLLMFLHFHIQYTCFFPFCKMQKYDTLAAAPIKGLNQRLLRWSAVNVFKHQLEPPPTTHSKCQ